jgi:hypothetical protein
LWVTSETGRAATAAWIQIPGQVMIFYSWIAVSGSDRAPLGLSGPPIPVAMGITDDRSRAMKAGEETLRSGRAAIVIIDVVRPGMAAHTLAPCYIRTGVGWLGRRTPGGDVAWDRFFL